MYKIHDELQKTNIDIVVVDEGMDSIHYKGLRGLIYEKQGHRLKGENNKAAQAICKLQIKKRVILSGTPLQNDLHEFFNIVDFVNPGLLGTYSSFRQDFEGPIVKSQQPYATSMDIAIGKASGDKVAFSSSAPTLR